jgi:hypothetical protein
VSLIIHSLFRLHLLHSCLCSRLCLQGLAFLARSIRVTRIDNQQSAVVLIAWVRSSIQSLRHQRQDLNCDRTTSKMRGLSPKIISEDSRLSENAQTHTYKHTIPYMKFKLKLLQIMRHVLEFTKVEAQKMLQK